MHSNISVWSTLLSKKHGPLALLYSAVNSMFYEQVKNYRTKKENIEDGKDEKNEKSCKTSNRSNRSKVYTYVEKINPEFVEVCPLNYLSKVTTFTHVYLFNTGTAKNFVALIIDDLLKNTSFVMEANPGFGVLTEELLKANVPFIHLFEDDLKFHSHLCDLQQKYPNRLDIQAKNLQRLYKYMFLEDITNKEEFSNIFKGIESRKWEEETCLQMIGTVVDVTFIRTLLSGIIYQNSFMSYGRPSFYLIMLPSLWKKLTSNNENLMLYDYKTILFQLFFEYEYLGSLDRLSFVPWEKKSKSHKKKNYKEHDSELFYAIKIEPKANLFTDVVKKEDLLYFWYFIRYNLVVRKRRIIPELEKWFPNCGIKLIAKHLNIFTQFGDLSPMELLELFKEVRSWPEFENSTFKISILINDLSQDVEI